MKHENPHNTVEKTKTSSKGTDMGSDSEKPLTGKTEPQEEPFVYAKYVVTYSKRAFGIGVSIHVFLLLLTAVLFVSGYSIIEADFSTLPLSLNEDSTKLRTDAWLHVHEDDSNTPSSSFALGQKERSILYMPLELFYEYKDGNVFSKESLLKIKENEDALFNDPKYNNTLCQIQTVNSHSACKRPLSVLRFFDGTYQSVNPDLYDPDFNDPVRVLSTAKKITLTSAILNFHIGKDAVINTQEATSKYTRSLMYFGWPLKGYNTTDQKSDEQRKKIDKAIVDLYADKLEDIYKEKLGDVNFYYFSLAIMFKAIESQVIYDLALAVASFVFIFGFMLVQTGSIWITSWGIFSIVSSFNIANLIYRIVFDYKYIGIFHVLAIFIILGIGSDNIFVFMDTWKEYGRSHPNSKDLVGKLSSVFRCAAKATFITSLTTTIAFLSNVQSPLLAVSSFGLFSAILVAVNYCNCTLFLPTVIIYHDLERKGRCCCWATCRHTKADQRGIEMEGPDGYGEIPPSNNKANFVITFLGGWFYEKLITHKRVRLVLLLLFFAIVCTFIGFAAKLGPDKEQVQIFGANTNWGKVAELRKSAFVASQEDDVLVVHIIWGLGEQDRSSCHHTDFKCKGRTVLDQGFDVNPPPCQTALLSLCEKFQNLSHYQESSLRLRRNQITGKVETQCVFNRLNEWLGVESNKSKYPAASDFTMPTSSEKIRPLMAANPGLYDVSALPKTFYRYFEVAFGYFIFDGQSPGYANTYDFEVYKDLVGASFEAPSGDKQHVMQGSKYGHRLKYLAVALNTTIDPNTLSYEEGLPIYDDWEEFVNNEMNELPPSCSKGFQATVEGPNTWHWLKVQQILVKSAITGILIGLFSSFAVLVLATTNVIVGALAALTISLVTVCVLGTITMLGWKLGVLESLNLTLVVGLAVDYVVHLAEGYMHLHGKNRLDKVHHTLTHVGISVLSGACSTLGASIFMLAAKIIFFFQFGIFMFCTIGLSIIFSLLFFTTMLALVGPGEKETGSIMPLFEYCLEHVKGKRKNNTRCSRCHGKGYVAINKK